MFNSDLCHRHKCLRTLCRRFSRHPSPSLSVRLHYVNDLPSVVANALPLLFADDTKCVHKIKDPSDCALLQSDVDALCDWSLLWKFKESKCALVKFAAMILLLPPAVVLMDMNCL